MYYCSERTVTCTMLTPPQLYHDSTLQYRPRDGPHSLLPTPIRTLVSCSILKTCNSTLSLSPTLCRRIRISISICPSLALDTLRFLPSWTPTPCIRPWRRLVPAAPSLASLISVSASFVPYSPRPTFLLLVLHLTGPLRVRRILVPSDHSLRAPSPVRAPIHIRTRSCTFGYFINRFGFVLRSQYSDACSLAACSPSQL